MAAGDIAVPETLPTVIAVRGARHNNLRDIDVDVPLWRTVAVVGVSGSGKTSLAMGTPYAEGLHRFLDSLTCLGLGHIDLDVQYLPDITVGCPTCRGARFNDATLAGVFDRLLAAGATIIVMDHDLDLLAAADHLIDMGPGGGPEAAASSPRARLSRSRAIRAA